MAYQIRFDSIELITKRINTPPPEKPEKTDYAFNFSVGVSVIDNNSVIVITEISIYLIKDNKELAQFQTAMVFEFPEFDELFKKVDESRFEIPVDLEILLKSAGISTTRGIIYSEVRGTHLHGAVLPLIDIAGVVLKDRAEKTKAAG